MSLSNGLTIYQEVALKSKETIHKIQKSGLTRAQEIGLKGKETRNKIQENGKTIYQEISLKVTNTTLLKGKWFNIFSHKNELIYENVPNRVLHCYCQALPRSSKEKPVGISSLSKIRLNKDKKFHLVNHYVEEVFPSEETKLKRLEKEIVLF